MKTDNSDWSKATKADILSCFRLILDRKPNPEEEKGHFSQVGGNLPDIVRSYLQSAEFTARGLFAPRAQQPPTLSDKGAFKIYAREEDISVGRHVLGGDYEPHVQATFRRHIRPGMSVLDIGANIGFFTMLSASLVGPAGRVFAIEPNAENVKLIEASRRENGFEQVSILAAGAGSKMSLLALHASFSNGSAGPLGGSLDSLLSSTVVPVIPLDRVLEGRWDFVKIDVEGHELEALHGMRRVLVEQRPFICSEFAGGGIVGGAREYLKFLEGLDYDLAHITEDGKEEKMGVDQLLSAYQAANTDHIDICAIPRR